MTAVPNDPVLAFERERREAVEKNATDDVWRRIAQEWMLQAVKTRYMYNFTCLGRPIIQAPFDIVAMQELIWDVRPDLIIETGIAHGGSLILSASMLTLLDHSDAAIGGTLLDPRRTRRRVLGVDIDIRPHNRAAIEAHPLRYRIDMIEGSSIDPDVIAKVSGIAKSYERVLVCLDSNHTHDHVLAELVAYAPLASVGSYCCVFDTIIEDLPEDTYPDRPWGKGNSPRTAVQAYLHRLRQVRHHGSDGRPLQFEIDRTIENRLLVTVAPGGYLKRV